MIRMRDLEEILRNYSSFNASSLHIQQVLTRQGQHKWMTKQNLIEMKRHYSFFLLLLRQCNSRFEWSFAIAQIKISCILHIELQYTIYLRLYFGQNYIQYIFNKGEGKQYVSNGNSGEEDCWLQLGNLACGRLVLGRRCGRGEDTDHSRHYGS